MNLYLKNILVYSKPHFLWLSFSILFFLLYQPTLLILINRWSRFDEAYGYAIFILLIAAYLMYRVMTNYKNQFIPNYYYSVPLIGLSMIWSISYYLGIDIIQQLLLPLMILLVMALVYGSDLAGKCIFPISYLYFAIPIWDYLTNILIKLTTTIVNNLISITEIIANSLCV